MSWPTVLLGAALGFGVVLVWQGMRRLADKTLEDRERRIGFWRLNAGLLVVAASMILFMQVKGG